MKTMLTILAIAFPVAIIAIPAQASVPTGDFDGDGRSDVFWRNVSTGANSIWKSANIMTPQRVVSVTNLHWYIADRAISTATGARTCSGGTPTRGPT